MIEQPQGSRISIGPLLLLFKVDELKKKQGSVHTILLSMELFSRYKEMNNWIGPIGCQTWI